MKEYFRSSVFLILLYVTGSDNCYSHCKCTDIYEASAPGTRLSPHEQLLLNLRKQKLYGYVAMYENYGRSKPRGRTREMTCVGLGSVPDKIPIDVKRLNMYGGTGSRTPGEQADQAGSSYTNRLGGYGLAGDQLHSLTGRELERAKQLEHLVIASNDIKILEQHNLPSGNLIKLKLVKNGLLKISADALRGMEYLAELDFSDNKISLIYNETFKGLHRLRFLNLASNLIKRLPLGIFEPISSLERLDLSKNKLTELQKGVFDNLWNLKELKLSHNSIRTIYFTALYPLKAVTDIHMSGNKLNRLHLLTFRRNRLLKQINLSRNRIEHLEENLFESNRYLRNIQLDRNRLSKLPSKIFKAQSFLNELNLSKNKLATLPIHLFVGKSELVTLDLSRNGLKQFSTSQFSHLIKLQRLDLSFNKLRVVESKSFIGLENLLEIRLNNNRIRHLADSAFQVHTRGFASKITWLYLENNRLQRITKAGLDGVRFVKYLNLGNNKLKGLDGNEFYSTNHLNVVLLNSNDIKEIPSKVFFRCPLLKEISLSSNRIRKIELNAFSGLEQLNTIDLTNNMIKKIAPLLFNSTPRLSQIKLSENLLEKFDMQLFLNTLTRITILELSMNNIQEVVLPAFSHRPLTYLSLKNNFLTSIPSKMRGILGTSTEVILDGNPLHCDCNARWMRYTDGLQDLTCASPEYLKQKKLYEVPLQSLTCTSPAPPNRIPGIRTCAADQVLITQYSERPAYRAAQSWLAHISGSRLNCHVAARISPHFLLIPVECARDIGVVYNSNIQLYRGGSRKLRTSHVSPIKVLAVKGEESTGNKKAAVTFWMMKINSPETESEFKYPCISTTHNNPKGIVATWQLSRNKVEMFKLKSLEKCGSQHLCGISSGDAHGKNLDGSPLYLLTGTGRWSLAGLTIDYKLNRDRTVLNWKFVIMSDLAISEITRYEYYYS